MFLWHTKTMDSCLSLCGVRIRIQAKHVLKYSIWMVQDDPKLRVIVERYPFLNAIVGGSILVVKSSLYLTRKKTN